MKPKLLISNRIPTGKIQLLFDRFECVYPSEKLFSRQEILERIPEFDALISMFNQPIDKEFLDRAVNLKVISNYAVGYDNIDIEYATQKNITVCNTPDVVTEPTAEIAMALMLSVMHRVCELDRRMRTEENFKWGLMENLGYNLHGKTLGIIGMGKIGQSVAKKAATFGMKTIYFNRNRLSLEKEKENNAVYSTFENLLKEADVISLHCPHTKETHQLISTNEFSMMKQSAFLINTARGKVVDELALIEALKTGKIKGAGLDVFENEPKVPRQLLEMNNTVCLPHIGTGTYETRDDMSEACATNILEFFDGKTPKNKVSK